MLATIWTGNTGADNNIGVTVTYTNQAGTTGRTASINWSLFSLGQGNAFSETQIVPLQAGDTGVRAITGSTPNQTTTNPSPFGFVLAKVLAVVPCSGDLSAGYFNSFLTTCLPAIDSNACISFLYAMSGGYTTTVGATYPTIVGSLSLIEG